MRLTELQYQEIVARMEGNKMRHAPIIKAPDAVEAEADLAEQVRELCRVRGLGLIMSRTDKRSTIGEGIHDATIFAEQGKVYCFELKDREGKLSTKQQAWIALQRKNGHTVYVVRALQEVTDIMYQPQLLHSTD